jgi:DNA-binding NarL/FixJ family response regulator
MRVALAEDSVLFREGLVRLLTNAGHQVLISVGDADSLVGQTLTQDIDIVIADVRMPPSMTDDGVRAARTLRAHRPDLPILLLSQHIETRQSVELVSSGAFGYLLKDRVLRVDDFLDAIWRVGAGGSALDPAVVGALVAPRPADEGLCGLSHREREVLSLVAQGLSNTAIGARLFVTDRTVESHMRSIFQKLDLFDSEDTHRRVLAVLTYLIHHRQPPLG